MATTPKATMLDAVEKGLESVKQRPFDTYLLGPFLIWFGLQAKSSPRLARKLVLSAGIWQIFYSWRKYREIPGHIAKGPQKFLDLKKEMTDV